MQGLKIIKNPYSPFCLPPFQCCSCRRSLPLTSGPSGHFLYSECHMTAAANRRLHRSRAFILISRHLTSDSKLTEVHGRGRPPAAVERGVWNFLFFWLVKTGFWSGRHKLLGKFRPKLSFSVSVRSSKPFVHPLFLTPVHMPY